MPSFVILHAASKLTFHFEKDYRLGKFKKDLTALIQYNKITPKQNLQFSIKNLPENERTTVVLSGTLKLLKFSCISIHFGKVEA
jgi:hypothetical protein